MFRIVGLRLCNYSYKELKYEKNISAEQNQACQNTRLFKKDVNKAGQKDYQQTQSQRKEAFNGVIWKLLPLPRKTGF